MNGYFLAFFWLIPATMWMFEAPFLILFPDAIPPKYNTNYEEENLFQWMWYKALSLDAQFTVPFAMAVYGGAEEDDVLSKFNDFTRKTNFEPLTNYLPRLDDEAQYKIPPVLQKLFVFEETTFPNWKGDVFDAVFHHTFAVWIPLAALMTVVEIALGLAIGGLGVYGYCYYQNFTPFLC